MASMACPNKRIEPGALLQKAPARSNPMMEHSPGLWPRYACSGGQVHATGYGRSWIVLSPTPNPPGLPILIPLSCLGAGSARIFVATISCASGNAWAPLFPHAVPIEKGRATANFFLGSPPPKNQRFNHQIFHNGADTYHRFLNRVFCVQFARRNSLNARA